MFWLSSNNRLSLRKTPPQGGVFFCSPEYNFGMPTTLSDRLNAVRERLALSCQRANRALESVSLLAVTKTRTEAELLELYGLGLREFGENRLSKRFRRSGTSPPTLNGI